MLATAAHAAGQGAAPPPPPLGEPATETRTLRTNTPSLVTEILIENPDPQPRRVRLRVASATRKDDGGPIAAKVSLPGRQDGAGEGIEIVVPGRSDARALVTASLDRNGEYEIRLVRDVEDGNGGAAKRHDIRLMATRDSAPIGPDLLSPLQPLQIEKSLWPFGRSPTVTLLALHNGSDRSVEFSTPAITAFQRDGGGGVVGSEAATVTPGPASVTRLIPGAATNYTLALPSALSAGKYKLTMLVAGTGGGVSERALEISVRASWLVAFTLFTLGALAGHIVSQWRGRGQRMVDDFIRLARLRDELSRIEQEAAATQTNALAAGLKQLLAEIDRRARDGGDVTNDIAGAGDRVAALGRFSALALQARATATFEGDPRPARVEAIVAAFAAQSFDPKTAAAALEAYAADVRDAPMLADVTQRALAGIRESDALAQAETTEEIRRARDALNAALSERSAGSAAERRQKLESLLDALFVARRSAPRARPHVGERGPAVTAEAMRPESPAAPMPLPGGVPVPGGFGVTPDPGLFAPPPGLSLVDLQAYRSRWRLAVNTIAVVFIGLGGVWALWLNNPTWGGPADLLTALFAGAATRLVVGEAGSGGSA
jgi:hypothetical protein